MKHANIQQSIVRKKQNMFLVIPFMKRMVFVGFVVIGLVFVGAGCGLTKDDSGDTDNQETSQSENGDSGNQTDKNDQDNDQDNTSEIDTSDWQTYRNEEYGFEVRYPEDRTAIIKNQNGRYAIFEKSENDFISIKITDYNSSPDKRTDEMHALTPTKEDLAKKKQEIESNSNLDIKDFFVKGKITITTPPFDGFIVQYQFFSNNDLVEISYILTIEEYYIWPDNKDEIQQKIDEIDRGEASDEVLDQIKMMGTLIQTLEKI